MVSPSLIALLSLVCCTVPIHSSPTNNTILKGGGGGGGGKGGSSAPRVVPHIVDPIVVAPKAIASTPEVEDPAVAVVPKAGAAATVPAASVPTAGAANTPSAASQSVAPAVVPAYRLVTSDVTVPASTVYSVNSARSTSIIIIPARTYPVVTNVTSDATRRNLHHHLTGVTLVAALAIGQITLS